jgi:hypothetical protein
MENGNGHALRIYTGPQYALRRATSQCWTGKHDYSKSRVSPNTSPFPYLPPDSQLHVQDPCIANWARLESHMSQFMLETIKLSATGHGDDTYRSFEQFLETNIAGFPLIKATLTGYYTMYPTVDRQTITTLFAYLKPMVTHSFTHRSTAGRIARPSSRWSGGSRPTTPLQFPRPLHPPRAAASPSRRRASLPTHSTGIFSASVSASFPTSSTPSPQPTSSSPRLHVSVFVVRDKVSPTTASHGSSPTISSSIFV